MLEWIKKSKCRFAEFIRRAGEDYANGQREEVSDGFESTAETVREDSSDSGKDGDAR